MDKYVKGFKKKIEPRVTSSGDYIVEPFREAQTALSKGQFAKKEREEFFTDAYTNILVDLFSRWVQTEPHEQKLREYLYHSALALGSVKEQLIACEMYGDNVKFMKAQEGPKDTNEQ